MKQIKLTHGKYAIVDDEDFEKVNCYKWRVDHKYKNWYAVRAIRKSNGKWTTQRMHRFIMNVPDGLEIDHISHDILDNRKCNLRV